MQEKKLVQAFDISGSYRGHLSITFNAKDNSISNIKDEPVPTIIKPRTTYK